MQQNAPMRYYSDVVRLTVLRSDLTDHQDHCYDVVPTELECALFGYKDIAVYYRFRTDVWEMGWCYDTNRELVLALIKRKPFSSDILRHILSFV